MKQKPANILFALLILAVLGFATTGCGTDGPDVYEVSGTITYNGKPVPNIEVHFVPEDTITYKESMALSGPNGEFVMTYTYEIDGVAPGKHLVYVTDPAAQHGEQSSTEPDYLAIIAKYGSEEITTKEVTIESDTIDLALDFEE